MCEKIVPCVGKMNIALPGAMSHGAISSSRLDFSRSESPWPGTPGGQNLPQFQKARPVGASRGTQIDGSSGAACEVGRDARLPDPHPRQHDCAVRRSAVSQLPGTAVSYGGLLLTASRSILAKQLHSIYTLPKPPRTVSTPTPIR